MSLVGGAVVPSDKKMKHRGGKLVRISGGREPKGRRKVVRKSGGRNLVTITERKKELDEETGKT